MKTSVRRCFRYSYQVFALIFGIRRPGRQLNERICCVKIFISWYNHQQLEIDTDKGGMTNAQI